MGVSETQDTLPPLLLPVCIPSIGGMGDQALEACKAGLPEDLAKLDPGGRGWPGLKDDRGATGVHYAAR